MNKWLVRLGEHADVIWMVVLVGLVLFIMLSYVIPEE
jgi:hypothetical protein